MKHALLISIFLPIIFIGAIQEYADPAYHFVQKKMRNANYTQDELLKLLQAQKRKTPLEPRKLSKKDHRSIQSLVTLLGLRSDRDGYLDSRTHSVLSLLPPEVINDCHKAMRRTWSLDRKFCNDCLPTEVYSLPLNMIKEVTENKKIRLTNNLHCPCVPASRVEREALLRSKSSIVFEVPFYNVRDEQGKLINRFDKRCTVNNEAAFIEVPNLKKLKWQELMLLHQMSLLNVGAMQGDVKKKTVEILYQYHTMPAKYIKNLQTLTYKCGSDKKNERSLFEMRIKEIELS